MSVTRGRRRNRRAFTLVEIVVVVLLLGILAGVAAPRLINVGEQATAQAVISDIDAIFTTAELYAAQHGTLPADAPVGTLPAEFVGMLKARVFRDGTPIGGRYDWNGIGTSVVVYGVSIRGPLTSGSREAIERQFDDGNLDTGWITRAQDAGIKFELAPNP